MPKYTWSRTIQKQDSFKVALICFLTVFIRSHSIWISTGK